MKKYIKTVIQTSVRLGKNLKLIFGAESDQKLLQDELIKNFEKLTELPERFQISHLIIEGDNFDRKYGEIIRCKELTLCIAVNEWL